LRYFIVEEKEEGGKIREWVDLNLRIFKKWNNQQMEQA
jgi:hypothetical protein